MMSSRKLKSLLEVAETKRATGTPNSCEWVFRKLQEDKIERLDFLGKIISDSSLAATAFELESEVALIDHALTAYPEFNAVLPKSS